MEDLPNIALRAYQLWDAAGRPEGRSEEFHYAAEQELRLLIEQKTAPETGDRVMPKRAKKVSVDRGRIAVADAHQIKRWTGP
jgi:Protein of unknown function (DUF2934)